MAQNLAAEKLLSFVPTVFVRTFAALKVPLLLFLWPRVLVLNAEEARVLIPLSRRSRNHVGSMYFGALAAGADLAAGVLAQFHISQQRAMVTLLFKDFEAKFHRRAMGDVVFICRDGLQLRELVAEAQRTGERVHLPVQVQAIVPSFPSEGPVADFRLTVSLKRSV